MEENINTVIDSIWQIDDESEYYIEHYYDKDTAKDINECKTQLIENQPKKVEAKKGAIYEFFRDAYRLFNMYR